MQFYLLLISLMISGCSSPRLQVVENLYTCRILQKQTNDNLLGFVGRFSSTEMAEEAIENTRLKLTEQGLLPQNTYVKCYLEENYVRPRRN